MYPLFTRFLACYVSLVFVATNAMAQSHSAMDAARNEMVDEEIVAGGVKNKRVIEAMRDTPRHEFVPPERAQERLLTTWRCRSAKARPSRRRSIVAYMTEPSIRSRPTRCWRSAPAAATRRPCWPSWSARSIRSRSSSRWDTRPSKTLKRLHYDNVHVKVGDGYQGWPEHAPFDKIIVTCSPEKVPPALVERTQGRRADGDSRRRAVSADALPAEEERRQAGVRGPAADAVRADDRRGGGQPPDAARPGQPDDRKRRI